MQRKGVTPDVAAGPATVWSPRTVARKYPSPSLVRRSHSPAKTFRYVERYSFESSSDSPSRSRFSKGDDDESSVKRISSAQYQLFRQAVTSSIGSYKSVLSRSKWAARASLLDLGEDERTERMPRTDQPSLLDTMASTAHIAQELKEDETVEKTTLSESLNTESSEFKHLTVKQVFPIEPYRLKIHKDTQYLPKPPTSDGFGHWKPPVNYELSHKMAMDMEELVIRSAIDGSLTDSMVASVISKLSPKDDHSKILKEKLAIMQEAQVAAMLSGFAAALNLQLLHRDALLQNLGFQPQVLSIVHTPPFEGSHVLGLEPKVLQQHVISIRQADRMAGSSVAFHKTTKDPVSAQASKKTSAGKKSQQSRTSVFDRLGSSTESASIQKTITQDT